MSAVSPRTLHKPAAAANLANTSATHRNKALISDVKCVPEIFVCALSYAHLVADLERRKFVIGHFDTFVIAFDAMVRATSTMGFSHSAAMPFSLP